VTKRNKGGRPPFQWAEGAEQQVQAAAFQGSPDKEIAAIMGCSVDTLTRKFGGILSKQRAMRKLAIRAAQQRFALKGNPALLIWLGKQPDLKGGLGQQDEVTLGGQVDMTKLSDAELEAIASGKARPRLKVEDGGKR
jgi:hypothetical protein